LERQRTRFDQRERPGDDRLDIAAIEVRERGGARREFVGPAWIRCAVIEIGDPFVAG
jgi:hypothetical protein